MFYVYLLKSQKNNDIYVGFSSDLRQRVSKHNSGEVRSTKVNRPWTLIYYEAYLNELDARRRELNLKQHKPKKDLLKQLEKSVV